MIVAVKLTGEKGNLIDHENLRNYFYSFTFLCTHSSGVQLCNECCDI